MGFLDKVLVLDFGSQTTQLIARRVRELGVQCLIVPCTSSVEAIQGHNPAALIFSGGPASVDDVGAPELPAAIFELRVPILGICYGMQAMTKALGGQVQRALHAEFGARALTTRSKDPSATAVALFDGLSLEETVWMSHQDQILRLPDGFRAGAHTATCPVASMHHADGLWHGVQFHPEVTHTKAGKRLLSNLLFKVARLKPSWTTDSFVEESIKRIKREVGQGRVVMALSGGVDSSVAATLIQRAIGDQLTCIFVDHGLCRAGDLEAVQAVANAANLKLHIVDASELFLSALRGVSEAEQKRKIVGRLFIEVFEKEAERLGGAEFLGQGTLYPDVIESLSPAGGPSARIKSHHNVGGLPENMRMRLVEPLRELFKDEVRKAGAQLGLPTNFLKRQPFPGPGFAVRIAGEVNQERCHLLRQADSIVREEIESQEHSHLWQYFAIYLPVQSVGVMGDGRRLGASIVVRVVESEDGMTADWCLLDRAVLARISNRILNEVSGITRVLYDVSSKPPATIEWE